MLQIDVETIERLHESIDGVNLTAASLRWIETGMSAVDGFCEDIETLWYDASPTGEVRSARLRRGQLELLHHRRAPIRFEVSLSIDRWLADIDDGGEPLAPQGFACEPGLIYTQEDVDTNGVLSVRAFVRFSR